MTFKLAPIFAAATLLLAACGGLETDAGAETSTSTTSAPAESTTTTAGNPDPTDSTAPDSTTESESSEGAVVISLEPLEGVFIEGFEIGIRIETADGEVLLKTLWTDYVRSLGDTDFRAYYESVLTQQVPAGPVVVLATVNIGAGPAPVTPDINGPLACKLKVEVPADGEAHVEIGFDGRGDCLSEIS